MRFFLQIIIIENCKGDVMKKKKEGSGHPKRVIHILTVLAYILIIAATVLALTARWVMSTWANLSMSELMYQLSAPIAGTSDGIILDAVVQCVIPAVLIIALVSVLFWKARTRKIVYRAVLAGSVALSAAAMFFTKTIVWNTLAVDEYLNYQSSPSTFIEDHYVDPADTQITFPEKKRNLIYIYLESMETTYSDMENGGAFEENVIPELTEIAEQNEDFSGSESILNGAYALPYTTFTMGAMFGHTSGLPLKNNLENNDMVTQSRFFADTVCLGDILEENGYSNTLLLGSDATFGGRRLYFSEHGDYTIYDYLYAKYNDWIPDGYKVWWGYEDEKLFSYAKDILNDLSSEEQPFNLTMLTVDTHFEDGYECDLCEDTFGDNQYANVMACSSRQVASFLEWCSEQPWYENTTIILAGDHPTMDSDFTEDIAENYQRRAFVAYINSAVSTDNTAYREYSTLDHFPTTLASLGVFIEGDRLGLGTNLFSDTPTLIEQYGLDTVTEELNKKSEFMEKLADIDFTSEELRERQAESYHEDHGSTVYH